MTSTLRVPSGTGSTSSGMLCSLLLLLPRCWIWSPIPAPAPPPHTVIAQGVVELADGTYAWSHTAPRLTETVTRSNPPPLGSCWRVAMVQRCSSDRTAGAPCWSDSEAQFSPDASVSWTAIAMAESGGGDGRSRHPTRRHRHRPRRAWRRHLRPSSRLARRRAAPPRAGWRCVAVRSRATHPGFVIVLAGTVVDDAGTTVEPGGTVLVAGAAT